MIRSWLPALAALASATASLIAGPKPEYGRIELISDTWGIPHIFAATDCGAMYGLGYACADQRGFQMTYSLRIIQGRLAEVLGDRTRPGGSETALDRDRQMRTFGWARAAARTAATLDADTLRLLTAYCEGVNDSFATQQIVGKLHPLFQRFEVKPEPWTPADCLLSWWHLSQFFASDGTRDLISWRNRAHPRPGQPFPVPGPLWTDDAAAVVQREDVSKSWLRDVEKFHAAHPSGKAGASEEGPKFSHAWVVGGKRTTTGAAVLVSDPQTPVRNPSLWFEFHVSGKTFDARGIGVPGTPGLLVGFNRRVAWGLTALGADQADLFRLETAPDHPDEYRWDGKWRRMETLTEKIRVRGGPDVTLIIRETHLGPVVSEFCFRQPGDPEVALKRVPLCDREGDTIQGVFAMMRARDAGGFGRALDQWRFPSAHCLYGDARGHIGYSVLGAIPVRSRLAADPNGNEAGPGTGNTWDWEGFVPPELLPRVADPKAGFLLSANHRPVASFYPLSLGLSTGSMGDTVRSWRLRERLSANHGKFNPADVLAIHDDTVNPARREIVRLGLHIRDTGQGGLRQESLKALEILEKWFKAGASSDLKSEGAVLATRISTFFRFIVTPLALKYGGGETGLTRFLKDAARRMNADANAPFSEDERGFIDTVLAGAMAGDDPREAGSASRTLGWFDSLDGFGSLDPDQNLTLPGITCLDGQTIHSQGAQSYTQWVPLDDVDAAKTICPIGHSDRPDSPYRTSTMTLWGEGKLHPAPLSRTAVNKILSQQTVLSR
jgi:penicillin amidase